MQKAIIRNVKNGSFGFIFFEGKRIFVHRSAGQNKCYNFCDGWLICFEEKNIEKTQKGYTLNFFYEGWETTEKHSSSSTLLNHYLPLEIKFYIGGEYYRKNKIYYEEYLENSFDLTDEEIFENNLKTVLSTKNPYSFSSFSQYAEGHYFVSETELEVINTSYHTEIKKDTVRSSKKFRFCDKDLYLIHVQTGNFPDVKRLIELEKEYQERNNAKKTDDTDMTFQFTMDIHGEND